MKQDGTKADLLQVKDNVFKSAPYLSRIRLRQIMTNPFSGLQNHVSLRHRWGQLRSVGSCHALQRRIFRDLVVLLDSKARSLQFRRSYGYVWILFLCKHPPASHIRCKHHYKGNKGRMHCCTIVFTVCFDKIKLYRFPQASLKLCLT